MNSRNREMVGVIVAPLVIPFALLIFIGTSGLFGEQGVFSVFAVTTSVIFSYLGMLVLGLPVIIFLKKFGRYSLGWVFVAGAVCGAIVWFVFLGLFSGSLYSESGVSYLSVVAGAVLGAMVSLTYSLIAGIGVSGRAI